MTPNQPPEKGLTMSQPESTEPYVCRHGKTIEEHSCDDHIQQRWRRIAAEQAAARDKPDEAANVPALVPARVARYAEALTLDFHDAMCVEGRDCGWRSLHALSSSWPAVMARATDNGALLAVADAELAAAADETRHNVAALVESLDRVAEEREAFKAERNTQLAEVASRGEQICALVDDRATWRERALLAEARVQAVEALLEPDTTWRCSACGWVASEETIHQALWHEADKHVSMICPECSAEGAFVDHEPLVEVVSALVHQAWMRTKGEQGVTSRPSEWGEEQMVPYADLSERAKDLDRGTVNAVLAALRAALSVPAADADGGE